ncbi:hypothetical protein PVAP13_4NG071433 [Panicum virgatum]|uniref:SAM domain-containing protein n=1 Tax=Panicum virgatum TaxID=38727 RepID=A0A8T0T5T3_PANVG|nr:hypothetical protein PVAP13_4NG071433 [Panicum virgatum]
MLQRTRVCRCLAAARLAARRRAEGMDWYAWLCRAGLHPDVALEYALLFARNELGAGDVRHLDHEVLASMGVAVAKHRIEILKLARRESSRGQDRAAAVHALATPQRGGRAAHGWGWGAIVASPVAAAARGGIGKPPLPMVLAQVSSPVVLTSSCAATVKALPAPPDPAAAGDGCGGEESVGDGEEEMDGGEEMWWESMFQDLKPT